MPNHLSVLGIIHTAISILALLAAFYALYRDGKINPSGGPGKWYIILTILTCLTSLPIMKTGHFTPAHYVAIIILILLAVGFYATRIFGKAGDYVQVVALSTTIFLSWVPTIIETLTRVPISGPIADGPNAPIIQTCLLVLFVLFIAGLIYQLIKLRRQKKSA